MVEGRENKVVSFCLMRVWFGVSGESQFGNEVGSVGFGRTTLCTELVAERDSSALTSEKVLKAFLGSVHWMGLDLVINNWLMDFLTLTGSHVASGRNLLFKYIKQRLHKNVNPCVSLGSAVFHFDFFCFDFVKAIHL